MTLQVDRERLAAAHHIVRSQLLAERTAAGHWIGELSSSPLATATAISALVLAEQSGTSAGLPDYTPGEEPSHVEDIYRGDLSELIVGSLHWLAEQQNDDGGWGDTDRSRSNIATTMLVQAAFHLTGVPAKFNNLLQRAQQYVEAQGGVVGLKKRYGNDKTFAAPILANYALADLVPWRKVPAFPFELACLPQAWYRHLRLSVVSYAIPALVAIGQVRFHHAPPRNPILRWMRAAARKCSLAVLQAMQPTSGGFLEATPLTSFVVMSLAGMGLAEHPVARRGVEFLLASVRPDGSWPIDTNLAVWNTTQAVTALDWDFEREPADACLDWLLNCQHRTQHPYTGAAPGGWAWTDLAGGVPDGDDTSAALLALAAWRRRRPEDRATEVKQAALAGMAWLLDLQNNDGGWPTFCRGWGKLPFDRSGADLTAHALRALHAWRELLRLETSNTSLARRIAMATHRGLRYLETQQQADGSWLPLWFGNQYHPEEANPVYGTARVLVMCSELGLGDSEMARRGRQWLVDFQHASGGWGPVPVPVSGPVAEGASEEAVCSVEETALALEALLPFCQEGKPLASSVQQGLHWLVEAVHNGQHLKPAPIGFYFAKLWYHERLYPQIFATRTLARACRETRVEPASAGAVH